MARDKHGKRRGTVAVAEREEERREDKRGRAAAPPPEVVVVPRGALTALGEGNDAQTRFVHWPRTDASGVTLGKGYDLGSRTRAEVLADLAAAGMAPVQAERVAAAVGLKGDAAGGWVNAHREEVGEIPVDVQRRLLAAQLDVYTARAKATATDPTADPGHRNAAGRERKEGKPGAYVLSGAQWDALHPAIVELLTDLIYQGGYYGWDRVAKVNALLKAHEADAVAQARALRDLLLSPYMDRYANQIREGVAAAGAVETFFGRRVEVGGRYRRNLIRATFLEHVAEALTAGREVRIG